MFYVESLGSEKKPWKTIDKFPRNMPTAQLMHAFAMVTMIQLHQMATSVNL